MTRRVGARVPAPFLRSYFLRLYVLESISPRTLGSNMTMRFGASATKNRLVLALVAAVIIIDLKLAHRRFEPATTLSLQDHRQLPLRIGLKLLDRLQAPLEIAEQVPRHVALVSRCDAVIKNRISRRGGVRALLQLREPHAHLHLIPTIRLLPVVGLHLGMNEARDVTLIAPSTLRTSSSARYERNVERPGPQACTATPRGHRKRRRRSQPDRSLRNLRVVTLPDLTCPVKALQAC